VPGTLHQGLLALFQQDPWLAFDILGIARPADGTPIDRRAEIERDGKSELTVRQGYPDLVFVYRKGPKSRRGVVITVEAQKDYDAEKRWAIPVYQVLLADEHRLQTWAVVVSLDKQMSRSLRRWRDGEPPKVDVLLLDVETVAKSWLDDPARRPMAAVLAGALHGYAGDIDAARRAFQFTRTMPGKRGRRHGMTVLAALPEDQRKQLIEELPMPEQHSWMDVERRSGTYHFGVKEGREEGLEQGRKILLALIFELLDEGGVAVDAKTEARLRKCKHLPTLKRWARQAAHATNVADLFKTKSSRFA
jgi:hypothetical protein